MNNQDTVFISRPPIVNTSHPQVVSWLFLALMLFWSTFKLTLTKHSSINLWVFSGIAWTNSWLLNPMLYLTFKFFTIMKPKRTKSVSSKIFIALHLEAPECSEQTCYNLLQNRKSLLKDKNCFKSCSKTQLYSISCKKNFIHTSFTNPLLLSLSRCPNNKVSSHWKCIYLRYLHFQSSVSVYGGYIQFWKK